MMKVREETRPPFSTVCQICSESFSSIQALSTHIKWKHVHPVIHRCNICRKVFKTNYILKHHYIRMHTVSSNSAVDEVKSNKLCSICGLQYDRNNINNHFLEKHNIYVQEEVIEFNDMNEFFKWKEEMERETYTRFIKCRGSAVSKKGNATSLYKCYRDGYFSSISKGKRKIKRTGSNKINGHCPAKIQVKEMNHTVEIKFTKTHVGHVNEVGRLWLTKTEREIIATKIAMKIPIDDILSEIRDGLDKERIHRFDLITKKDLHNIIQAFNLHEEAVFLKKDEKVQHVKKNSNIIRVCKPEDYLEEVSGAQICEDIQIVFQEVNSDGEISNENITLSPVSINEEGILYIDLPPEEPDVLDIAEEMSPSNLDSIQPNLVFDLDSKKEEECIKFKHLMDLIETKEELQTFQSHFNGIEYIIKSMKQNITDSAPLPGTSDEPPIKKISL